MSRPRTARADHRPVADDETACAADCPPVRRRAGSDETTIGWPADFTSDPRAPLSARAGTGPPGRLVAGRYRVRSLLGTGGMARVWLGHDEVLARPVALKQCARRGGPGGGPGIAEARAAAKVPHTGTVTVYDAVADEAGTWIVMELLTGRTLAEALVADGPLPPDQVARIGLRLLDVLAAVHRAGVVHCDLKPDNVHLCPEGRVVLTDFGIACAVDGYHDVAPGGLAGSPSYIAPERIRGEALGPPSDLFSLGATLFTAVEGRSPFDRGEVSATLAAVVEDAAAPFLRADALRPAIEGLLAKDPTQRLDAGRAREALRLARSLRLTRARPGPDTSGRLSSAADEAGHGGSGRRSAT